MADDAIQRARDRDVVEALLGRPPQGGFEVVVRNRVGTPVVIRNSPFLDDGTPMPTMYWLVDPAIRRDVGRLESDGGVRDAEAQCDPEQLARAHDGYAAERDRSIADTYAGPRPFGGVGGTRRGVKCLHAHYAWFLAGGDDPVGRWVHGRLADMASLGLDDPSHAEERIAAVGAPVAAIDCGTNSTRLIIAEGGSDGRLVTLEREMRITRLGRGVDKTGKLDPAGVDATVEAIRGYQELIERHGVSAVRIVATSAARDAGNAEEFFDAVERITGVRPELLSGELEGRLSFAGAVSDLDVVDGPFLVVDIGGGSTEFCYGSAECEKVRSIDIGCVRITEKYIEHDPPLPEELYACLSVAKEHIEEIVMEVPEMVEAPTLVGLSGTVTTTAAIEIGLAEYDRDRLHHFVLTKHAAEDVFRTIATEAFEDRVFNPGLDRDRADVIVGGLCILLVIMRKWGFTECLVSEADILDGLASSLL